MWAAAIGCSAWASGEGLPNRIVDVGGGAAADAHNGHSPAADRLASPSSPVESMSFAPAAVQTS